ncbi:flagellar biosynthesis protein FliR [Cypionkella aquatica]|uniref:Flagellar biosynthesis protein FliR n=1 Tax=Cypionkella aquatica TaxID=1756042 RepID=A0AA37TZU4_9RHOB|nr:flagellar biosynthetic protein FliR [Cypionkella aquatica]GLS85195.1 flagellar biosynthesis protein FliR [Cypionkella aquatica]
MNELIKDANALTGIAADLLWLGALVFMRVGSMMSLLPAFGEQSVPQRVRLVLALTFTAVVAPAAQASPDPTQATLAPLLIEAVVGLMLGIGLRMFVLALQIAGAIAAQATSLSQMFGGAGPEPQPAIGNLMVMAGLALAVAAGLHVRAAELIILSYQLLPMGRLPAAADVAQWGLSQVTHAFSLAFCLAAPFTIAALLYNVAIGVINRAMPALMVSLIGAPALTLGGLILMALSLPLALALWSQSLQGFFVSPFSAMP